MLFLPPSFPSQGQQPEPQRESEQLPAVAGAKVVERRPGHQLHQLQGAHEGDARHALHQGRHRQGQHQEGARTHKGIAAQGAGERRKKRKKREEELTR